MGNYQLIAFDMDGTLLNSQKEITSKSLSAIAKAVQAGKTVILCTGRGPSELDEYIRIIPNLRYLNCASGALVYDLIEKRTIYSNPLKPTLVKQLLGIAAQEGAMPHLLSGKSIVQQSHWECMEQFGMAIYKPMFGRVAEKWSDLSQSYCHDPFPVEKLNLYHTSAESRNRTVQHIQAAGLEVSMTHAEISSLELSAKGVDKGTGLEKLCGHLGLPISQTIAVGDADNDIAAFKKAGLAIAMGNAIPRVKQIADAIVADCDHEGCAQAIETYLLG